MDSAEQAALSESDHDGGGGAAGGGQQTKRMYETHRFSDFGDGGGGGNNGGGGRGRDFLLKPMRRFDKLTVNLSLSSVLVPSGVDLTGKKKHYIVWIKNN